jgi:hypothetical protein
MCATGRIHTTFRVCITAAADVHSALADQTQIWRIVVHRSQRLRQRGSQMQRRPTAAQDTRRRPPSLEQRQTGRCQWQRRRLRRRHDGGNGKRGRRIVGSGIGHRRTDLLRARRQRTLVTLSAAMHFVSATRLDAVSAAASRPPQDVDSSDFRVTTDMAAGISFSQ